MTQQEIENMVDKRINCNGSSFSREEIIIASGGLVPNSITNYALTYNIDFYELTQILYDIIERIKKGGRFLEEDIAWLSDKNYLGRRSPLFIEYHSREAKYYANEYSHRNNPWDMVNACSSYRKSQNPQEALNITKKQNISILKNKKLKSAMLMTQGGAYRDLREFDKAIENAEEVFHNNPNDFRPCTLLGAIYYNIGEYSLGREWFDKAEQRGASKHNIDAEIKSIYRKMKGEEKKSFKKHLLELDPDRYSWINNNNFK